MATLKTSDSKPAGQYDFTYDYYENNIPLYEKYLAHLRGKPCMILEIGALEGGSTTWLIDNILTHENSFIDTIDVREWPKLVSNLAATGQANKVKFHLGRSVDILRSLPIDTYDFAIIDGSHWTINVLEDMVHAYRLLKVGGLMETDDYIWDDPEYNQEGTPKAAVDAFLSIYSNKLKIIRSEGFEDGSIWIEKIADPMFGL